MGALYGILGETDAEELHAIGERLVHRGAHVSEWKANASLRLGFRSDHSGTERLAEGPVTFDGCVDNREVLAGSRRPAAASPVDDALLILDQFHQSGEEAFSRIAGLFAVAIARPDGRLLLARDRIGYAPVYYTVDRGRFIFASEYKSLLAIPTIATRPNRDAIQTINSTK